MRGRWVTQGYFTNGYFVEAPSSSDASYLKKIEKKKLLSGVESLGLLSKAEKAGLTLSTVRRCCGFNPPHLPVLPWEKKEKGGEMNNEEGKKNKGK